MQPGSALFSTMMQPVSESPILELSEQMESMWEENVSDDEKNEPPINRTESEQSKHVRRKLPRIPKTQ